MFKSVKSGNPGKTVLLVSDIILTICMPVVIVTYIFIAKELFVIQSDISWTLLFNIHDVLSYAIRSDLYRLRQRVFIAYSKMQKGTCTGCAGRIGILSDLCRIINCKNGG